MVLASTMTDADMSQTIADIFLPLKEHLAWGAVRNEDKQDEGKQPHGGRTFFSMEHKAKLQPCRMARLQMSASIHSDFPELGTPVTIDSSPGTTCIQLHSVSSTTIFSSRHGKECVVKGFICAHCACSEIQKQED